MNLLLYATQLVAGRGGSVDLEPAFIGEFSDYDVVVKAAFRHVQERGRGFVFRVLDADCDSLARLEILTDWCEFTTEPFPEDEIQDDLYGLDGLN